MGSPKAPRQRRTLTLLSFRNPTVISVGVCTTISSKNIRVSSGASASKGPSSVTASINLARYRSSAFPATACRCHSATFLLLFSTRLFHAITMACFRSASFTFSALQVCPFFFSAFSHFQKGCRFPFQFFRTSLPPQVPQKTREYKGSSLLLPAVCIPPALFLTSPLA